ncbi:hypothetical protein PR202_ga24617 [Eleusine coracana subsp. coracana]|uniref:Terpene synthase metal-binding domain-containing protein n=1 Tax=Eleusine coracana subsp. coracana TaxID=191504 RepID=A0AAV5D9J3_ELECO|nr:hypothetical protein PR202_ga24617 [Eleusine coracana subsp. coracana]
MDENGKFSTMESDVDGLLNLYEAAHLGKCDEEFLNNAIIFTKDRLSTIVKDPQLPKPILVRIEHMLSSPTQRRMKRLEARLYMSIYENDEDNDQDILELAKLDFDTLQQMHRHEVEKISLWDVEGARKVGKCYEYVMSHLSDTLDEFAAETVASPVGIECTKTTVASSGMLQEVAWREHGHVPSLHDYLKVSAKTTLYWTLACISFFGMDASNDVFTWTSTFLKILESAAIICRLMDDISGNECEKERSKCATALDCYVREHGVTVQQAKQVLTNLVEEHWRIINQEFLSNDRVPAPLLMRVLNFVRMMETAYKHVDGYTHSEEIADYIQKILIECVHQ